MAITINNYTFKGYYFATAVYDNNEIADFIAQYHDYSSGGVTGAYLMTEGAVGGHGIITEAGETFKSRFKLGNMRITVPVCSYNVDEYLQWTIDNYLKNTYNTALVSSGSVWEDTSLGDGKKITQTIALPGPNYAIGQNSYFYKDDVELFRETELFPLGTARPYPYALINAPIGTIKFKVCAYNSTGTEAYLLYFEFYNTGVGTVLFLGMASPANVYTFFQGLIPTEVDPYTQGGTTTNGGGTGTFSHTGDDIDVPNLPTLGATDAGLVTLFVPSTGELRSLGAYMWSTNFDLETFKKVFANPIDCILGLSIVPVSVPTGSSSSVHVGNIDTGVSMSKASAQYVEVDCGTLSIQEYWGSYLDYSPYTKAEIYLPYVGAHAISVDDIMGNTVHVVYHVDILSGACVAFVKCGGSVLYSFIGQCSASIPICANDWTNVINGVMQIAGNIGTMIATGGLTAPGAISSTAAAVAQTAIASKPEIEKSGSLSGTGGMLGVQTPYLIITYPKQALPSRQNSFSGYPSHITTTLANITGFTIIETGHFEFMSCTQTEINEIENLLKGGVFI